MGRGEDSSGMEGMLAGLSGGTSSASAHPYSGGEVEGRMELAVETLALGTVLEDSPVVVMCHGNGFCRQTWFAVVDELRQRLHAADGEGDELQGKSGVRVVLLDLRGHGMSRVEPPWRPEDLRWESHGRDVGRTVRGLISSCESKNVRPHMTTMTTTTSASDSTRRTMPRLVLGVGHSLGATALILAELDTPGLFDALVVAEPVALSDDFEEPRSPLAPRAIRRRDQWRTLLEAHEHLARSLSRWDPRAVQGYLLGALHLDADGSARLACRTVDELRVYNMSAKNGVFKRLRDIQCPIYAIGGEHSRSIEFHWHTLRHLENLPQGSVDVAEGSGHNVPMEAPKKFAEVVARALKQTLNTTTTARL